MRIARILHGIARDQAAARAASRPAVRARDAAIGAYGYGMPNSHVAGTVAFALLYGDGAVHATMASAGNGRPLSVVERLVVVGRWMAT